MSARYQVAFYEPTGRLVYIHTLTAVDQLGWTFSGWSGGLTGSANPAVVSMNGPSSVTATFTAVPVDTLTTTLAGGGSLVLSPPGGVYNRGTVVTVTAVDASGNGSGASATVTVPRDRGHRGKPNHGSSH